MYIAICKIDSQQEFNVWQENEAEVDVSLELHCLFHDPTNAGNLISGSSALLKLNFYIWKFLVHVILKASLKNFEHNIVSMWNEHNCMAVWTFFAIAFLWDRTSLVDQMVKHLPTMQETQVRSLGQKDSLEKQMAAQSSTLAWKIPWTEKHGGLQSMGSQRVRRDWATSLHFLWDWNGNWPFPVLWPLLLSKSTDILRAAL